MKLTHIMVALLANNTVDWNATELEIYVVKVVKTARVFQSMAWAV